MKHILRATALGLAILTATALTAAAQDYDHDDSPYYQRHDRDDYRYNFQRGVQAARQYGYNDGVQAARSDNWAGKPFNPYPRGRFADADHGFRRYFGDLHEYREHYAEAYRQGYSDAFRGYRGYGYGYGRDRDDR